VSVMGTTLATGLPRSVTSITSPLRTRSITLEACWFNSRMPICFTPPL
jgi:hypothetical protein